MNGGVGSPGGGLRPGAAPGAGPGALASRTSTLVAQDPYTMTPQEHSRYEALFPTYAQPDDSGFVHGAAAVELFSKSGVERESLKAIWTMVDQPVDNKLDSLEFSLAMHLIVCLTKKGLPLPPSMPGSLARLVRDTREKGQAQQPGGQGTGPPGGAPGGMQPLPPSSPTRLPSPDKRLSMMQTGSAGNMPPPQQLGGMQPSPRMSMQGGIPPPPQQGQMPSPQLTAQAPPSQPPMGQPQMGGQMGGSMLPPQQPQMGQPQMKQSQMGGGMQQQMGGLQPTGSFGNAPVGGRTVDDAFAGMSNDPVLNVEEYSTIGVEGGGGSVSGGMSTAGGMSTTGGEGDNMSTIGGMSTTGGGVDGGMSTIGEGQQLQPTVEIATPEQSPQLTAQTLQPAAPMPAPPVQQRQPPPQQHQQQAAQQQVKQLKVSSSASAIPSNGSSSAELLELRAAHQKLQAEVISLRAKAAAVSEEEQEAQKEIVRVAGEIGRLGLELSELKAELMESRVKLTEREGVLKGQMEKKESLETQIKEVRETNNALASASEALVEASELAVSLQSRAVAASAAAKEEEQAPPVPVETADLFSWDAPTPAATPAAAPAPAWGSDAPTPLAEPQHGSFGGISGANNDTASVQTGTDLGGRPSDAASVSGHSVSGQSVHSNQGGAAPPSSIGSGMDNGFASPMKEPVRRDSSSMANPNPYGGFTGIPDPMGGGGGGGDADLFGMPLGGMAGDGGSTVWRNAGGGPPQPLGGGGPVGGPVGGLMGGPMGGGGGGGDAGTATAFDHQVAASLAFEQVQSNTQSVTPSVAPTPTASKTPNHNNTQQLPMPPSPSKAELEELKTKTTQVEKSFQSKLSLVRSISSEVTKLESVYKKAEMDMKSMETKKKKGGFGGKKKAKKEYEKALAVANQEKLKVREAKAQLAAAEAEAEKTKKEMEDCRAKYEQMELDAATVASVLSVQQSGNTSREASDMSTSTSNQYHDPFGGGLSMDPSAATSSSDPYGMGLMGGGGGGGGYDNPFAL